jgi:hypothetical protein
MLLRNTYFASRTKFVLHNIAPIINCATSFVRNRCIGYSPNNIMVSCLEAVNHPTLLLTSILHVLKVFKPLHMLWMMGIWVHPYTGTPMQVWGKNFGKLGLRVSPNNIMVSCLEAVHHYTLLLTSILHVLKVFKHLHMLWMGMWVHPYTLTPVHVGAKFWKYGG